MHLADAYIAFKVYIWSFTFPGNQTHDIASSMLVKYVSGLS